MLDPVTCKFDEDPVKMKALSSDRVNNIFPIISLWGKSCRSRASNSKANSPIWPNVELIRDFMTVLVTCKFKENPSKKEGLRAVIAFPHCKSMGEFGCRGNQSFYPMCPKTLCNISPCPSDATYKN